MVSFRLGGGDGVAIEAAKWAGALGLLGWTVRTVAGAGPVDAVLPGLAMDAAEPPPRAAVEGALGDADLVVAQDSTGLVVPAGGRTIAVLGIDDVVVVDTGDALLVTTTAHAQGVKAIVDVLKASGRSALT